MGSSNEELWPPLPLGAWRDTYETLHMYAQIVGKIRLALEPMMNEWWQVPLYLTTRGLTTSPMFYGNRSFQLDFDFHDHVLVIATNEGAVQRVPLGASVRAFYRELFSILRGMNFDVKIWPVPVEVVGPIPFEEDTRHATYDPAFAHRWWQIALRVKSVLQRFRAQFTGKGSPVMFFWGTFDLVVSRYSGRSMTPPGTDHITRWAYDQEVSSVGFWPGQATPFGPSPGGPAFFSYFAPRPSGIESAAVHPEKAYFDQRLGEHILMYDDIRTAIDPAQGILDFAQSVYDVGARLAHWPDFTPAWISRRDGGRRDHDTASSTSEASGPANAAAPS